MTTEKLVCTLETAKKLWDAGIRRETYFLWHTPTQRVFSWGTGVAFGELYFPAPTASEIGELLPKGIVINHKVFINSRNTSSLEIRHYHDWNVGYTGIGVIKNESLVEAMGQMLLWLANNDYLEKGK